MATTTPLKLITRALRDIGGAAAGEPISAADANDCFDTLNDMLDSWSNEALLVYAVQDVIHEITGGKYIYSIGPGGDVGCSFTGSISASVLTVSAISSGALAVGQVLSVPGATGLISITSYGTGYGGNTAAALGTYNLNTSLTYASGPITSAAVRPLRINSAFVRIVNSLTGTLDYPVAVINLENYELIGIKTLPGPWPRAVYYQPSEPTGILNYWPNPSAGEMHLQCDTVLNQFNTLNDAIVLPQGYNMAIRWGLAEMLMPEWGKNDQMMVSLVQRNAARFKGWVKTANKRPQQSSRFDPVLFSGKALDAGWILSGGFMQT